MSNRKGDISQGEAVFDLTALSPQAARSVIQHMDREGELMLKDSISLMRLMTVSSRAIATASYVSELADKATALSPQHADRFEEIADLAQEAICNIVRNGSGRY